MDIDGVLNSRRSQTAFNGYPHDFSDPDLAKFDWVAAGLVRRLCEETGAYIVLSSTWRYFSTFAVVARALDLPVIDFTPMPAESCYANRGAEIRAWLDAHPEVTRYAIVDDINAMLAEQQPYFVQTDERVGLSLDDYRRLCEILA